MRELLKGVARQINGALELHSTIEAEIKSNEEHFAAELKLSGSGTTLDGAVEEGKEDKLDSRSSVDPESSSLRVQDGDTLMI